MSPGIDPRQLQELVIRVVLKALGAPFGGPDWEALLLGTALQESGGGHFLHQLGNGPAHGVEEMQQNDHDDIWKSFLAYKPDLAAKVKSLMVSGVPAFEQLNGNLYYAVAMAAIHYQRACIVNRVTIPSAVDIEAQGTFYKRFYNTPGGAATTGQYVANWHAAMGGQPAS